MTLLERLRTLVEAGDPAGTVTLAWLGQQLQHEEQDAAPASAAVEIDLTVERAAELLDRKPSTVRSWCASGELDAYKLHGKEWRIPRGAIVAWQRRERSAREHGEQTHQDPHDRSGTLKLSAWRSQLPKKSAS